MNWLLRWTLLVVAMAAVAGILSPLVWFANEWVVSSLASTAVLAWLAGWLVIAYGRGGVRAAAIGAVVAGAAYWLLVFGPWFQTNIGSTLLTSRLLAWVEAKHRQPVQPAPASVFTTVNLNTVDMSSLTDYSDTGLLRVSPQYVATIPPVPQPPPGMTAFQSAGQWSFAWLFAVAGGILAAVLSRHRGNGTEKTEAAP